MEVIERWQDSDDVLFIPHGSLGHSGRFSKSLFSFFLSLSLSLSLSLFLFFSQQFTFHHPQPIVSSPLTLYGSVSHCPVQLSSLQTLKVFIAYLSLISRLVSLVKSSFPSPSSSSSSSVFHFSYVILSLSTQMLLFSSLLSSHLVILFPSLSCRTC